jgi:hypothetical protein
MYVDREEASPSADQAKIVETEKRGKKFQAHPAKDHHSLTYGRELYLEVDFASLQQKMPFHFSLSELIKLQEIICLKLNTMNKKGFIH